MAIINSYPTVTPTGSDLIIGTDVSVEGNPTKTFTIDSINALAPQGIDGTGIANRVPFFVDADTISSSSLIYTTTGGGSGGNLPYYNFSGTADIACARIITEDIFCNNISASTGGTVTVGNLSTAGNTIIGDSGTDTLTVNATSSFAADATFAAAADIVMSNTSKILLGTTMTIEHPLNGNAIISEVGGGSLSLFSDDTLEIKSGALGENYAKFTKDGPIELYYDNVKKFETASSSIKILGVPVHADNTAALAAGLTVGEVYRTGDLLKIVH